MSLFRITTSLRICRMHSGSSRFPTCILLSLIPSCFSSPLQPHLCRFHPSHMVYMRFIPTHCFHTASNPCLACCSLLLIPQRFFRLPVFFSLYSIESNTVHDCASCNSFLCRLLTRSLLILLPLIRSSYSFGTSFSILLT